MAQYQSPRPAIGHADHGTGEDGNDRPHVGPLDLPQYTQKPDGEALMKTEGRAERQLS